MSLPRAETLGSVIAEVDARLERLGTGPQDLQAQGAISALLDLRGELVVWLRATMGAAAQGHGWAR